MGADRGRDREREGERPRRLSIQRVILLAIVTTLAAAILPAGIVLERRLAGALENRAREELSMVPDLVADRNRAVTDAIMMHAKDIAGDRELAAAMSRGDRDSAFQLAERARGSFGDAVLLVDASGVAWIESADVKALVDATRRGESPVLLLEDSELPRLIGLAPILEEGEWRGAAGVAVSLDEDMAGTLGALTHSDVVILNPSGSVVASTASDEVTRHVVAALPASSPPVTDVPGKADVLRADAGDRRLLLAQTRLESATLVFVRDLDRELNVLPDLRAVAGLAAVAALGLALVVGWMFAAALARPVQRLEGAAGRLAEGDFTAHLEDSQIRELAGLSASFDRMRRSLAARMDELVDANRELEARQQRLAGLQSELIRRERTSATGWLVAQLAHEIRNPIAGLRSTLEVLRRRVEADDTGREFADLAIDELLRMHELSERILDLNRPGDPDAASCDVVRVAREVGQLSTLATPPGQIDVQVTGSGTAGLPSDVLKQVLLNLVQNAREARGTGLVVRIDVATLENGTRVVVEDNGPGVAPEQVERIFDPFFTTKGVAGGSGLGLYIAQGFVQRYGGEIRAVRSENGARFELDLPAAVAARVGSA